MGARVVVDWGDDGMGGSGEGRRWPNDCYLALVGQGHLITDDLMISVDSAERPHMVDNPRAISARVESASNRFRFSYREVRKHGLPDVSARAARRARLACQLD